MTVSMLVWASAAAGSSVAWIAAAALEVRVLTNGAPYTEVPTTLNADSWEDLRHRIESNKKLGYKLRLVPGMAEDEDWWLADTNGMLVNSWDSLVALPGASPLLSAVPAGRPYQWGPRAIGDRFSVQVKDRDDVELETIALSPRIFLIHNLFSEEDTLALIEAALEKRGEKALQTSGVGFKTHGERATGSTRTSASAFDSETPAAKALIARAFDVLRIPNKESMADGLQILRYQEGQAYIAHTDWFPSNTGDASGQIFDSAQINGSNRYATVFFYLWPPPNGGFTVFPRARVEDGIKNSSIISTGTDAGATKLAMSRAKAFYKKDDTWEMRLTEECYTKLAVKPVRLSAVLFYHQDPVTGNLLPEAEHGACPSLTGTKWGANLWVWNRARHLTKGGSSEPVSVEFINRDGTALNLAYSMDDGHTWTHFAAVAPGTRSTASSYSGHRWRFTQADSGDEIQRWAVPDSAKSAIFVSDNAEPLVPDKGTSEL